MNETGPTPLPPVRILCSADETYAAPLCVMLTSLVIHHAPDRPLEIHVLASRIPDADRRKIESSLRANRPDFALTSLHWLSADRNQFAHLHLGGYISLDTYSRLLAPQVLPPEWDRVLYLDSDVVVLADLSPLYDAPFEGRAVQAVHDIELGRVAPTAVFNYADLGIPPETRYFNSGILHINLRRWREDHIADRVLDYLSRHRDQMTFHDQAGLNAILYDDWKPLDHAWNQNRGILRPAMWRDLGYTKAEWRRAKNHPKIVHFTGEAKPWKGHRHLPGYSHFFTCLKKTPYRNDFHGPMLEPILGLRLYFFLWYQLRWLYRKLTGQPPKM